MWAAFQRRRALRATFSGFPKSPRAMAGREDVSEKTGLARSRARSRIGKRIERLLNLPDPPPKKRIGFHP